MMGLRLLSFLAASFAVLSVALPAAPIETPAEGASAAQTGAADRFAEESSDPIEPFNRLMFGLTHRVIVPILDYPARGYRWVTPHFFREGIRNFATNLTGPRRIVNNLLQAEWGGAGTETGRFVVNTTVGVAGLFDPATDWLEMPLHDEDFGQSFGSYGIGAGPPVELPLLGPSNPRDIVGEVLDALANPLTYVPGAGAVVQFNNQSMRLEEYEGAISAFADPYPVFRDTFGYLREAQVQQTASTSSAPTTAELAQLMPSDAASASPASLEELLAADPYLSSLGALLFEAKDPDFFLRADDMKARMSATGETLPFRLWTSETGAPVVFLLPGLAGHHTTGAMTALAEIYHDAGYHVVVISSAFHPAFFEHASTAPLPGHMETDSHDVYQAMLDILDHLETTRGLSPDRPAVVVGQSYGGLRALFIAEMERQMPQPRFSGYVALNPPVDMAHGIRELDRLFEGDFLPDDPEGKNRHDASVRRLAMFLEQTRSMMPASGPPLLRPEDAMFGMGLYFRMKLRDVIFQTQSRDDLSILRTPASGLRRQDRYDEILHHGFEDYSRLFVAPAYGETDVEGSFAEGSLAAIQPGLAANPRVRVMHSANDFFLRPRDIEFLQSTLGDRLVLFPTGGHCGNYHIPEVQAVFVEMVDSLIEGQ